MKWASGFLSVIVMTLGVTIVMLSGSKSPAQFPSFQPLLLAFDAAHDRLYAAIPSEAVHSFRLVAFSQPEKENTQPGASFDLPGICSGLSFDAVSDSLFVANAAEHELLIFRHIVLGPSSRPTRVLRRFNFPTGVYLDQTGGRLFVADAHPGSLVVFQHPEEVQGEPKPDLIISGEETGLNGPFSIAADTGRSRLYVSNFDGVLIFKLNDLSAPPDRLPLPPGTLARSLWFDATSQLLYIATPMLQSFFIYDGERLEQVRIEGVTELFPFSMALDSNNDRLYLAGTKREVGIIEQASGRNSKGPRPKEMKRPVDRWIRWSEKHPPLPKRPSPPPDLPNMGPETL